MIITKKVCVVSAVSSVAMLFVIGLSGCSGTLPQLPAVAPNAVTTSGPPPAQVNGTRPIAANVGEKINEPKTTDPTPALTLQEPSDARPTNRVIGSDTQIASFRASSVVMYFSETGSHGQRFAVSNLSLPMSIKYHSPSAKRIEIDMPSGPRWIDDKAVILAERSRATPIR